jgi:arylsulfatase
MAFSADETTDLGCDSGTPVTDDLGPKEPSSRWRGPPGQIDLGADADDAHHLISPEPSHRTARAR